MELRISGVMQESIVDGPGLRFVIFTQGCPHHCDGCHNPQTHDFDKGKLTGTDELYERYFKNPILQGVTLSGGEPFIQPAPLAELCERFKSSGVNIIIYSGFTYEELLKLSESDEDVLRVLSACDTLVDGRFDISRKSLALKFRGSTNQRVIDLPASLKSGSAVIKEL